MIRTISLARRWATAAAMAALAFGATQALARPAEAAPAQACLKYECMTYCQSRGGEGICFLDTCVCRIRH